MLGHGQEASGGRKLPSILCDLFESFLGALLMDQGLAPVQKFIEQLMFPKIDAGVFEEEMDFKTHLQEVLQRNGDVDIRYILTSESGPAHEREFHMSVQLSEKEIGLGTGKSKKLAEQAAAKNALENLKEI
jgi:ribonuclease-3